jgi:hypothetical protein
VREPGIPVVRDPWLDREGGVAKRGERIAWLTTLDGCTSPTFTKMPQQTLYFAKTKRRVMR